MKLIRQMCFAPVLGAALVLAGCSDGSDRQRTESLTVTSYNVGLALNFVPLTQERLVANERLLADYDSDVLCLQEVWLEDHMARLRQALEPGYPHVYTVPAEQIFSESAACTADEVAGFENCARTQCPGLSGSDLVSCATAQCGAFIPQLSSGCFDAVVGAVGTPNITVDALVDAVTQPVGKFAYDGSLGLLLASRYPLRNREFQDLIEDSSANHRGALYAEVEVNNQTHLVGCTHTTADLSASIPYPESGLHGSWEGENRFMQEQLIAFAQQKAQGNPVLFAGDFNCSIANAANGVDAEFGPNCRLWRQAGFADPVAEQLPCTFCYEDNTILQRSGRPGGTQLDHVFVANLPADSASARRVFDTQVSVEAVDPVSELAPEDSPIMSHPSDHFGVEVQVSLP